MPRDNQNAHQQGFGKLLKTSKETPKTA